MLATQQIKIFLIFITIGIIISFIFDIFRIMRKVYKFSNMMIYMQDILFWLLAGIIILYSIFLFNSGELRIYLFLSIFIGIVVYTCTISNYILTIGTSILKVLNKLILILFTPFQVIYKIIVEIPQNISLYKSKMVKKSEKEGF